jgi:hypothetical protein
VISVPGPAAQRFFAKDGFNISLSASEGAYATPRKDLWEPQSPYYNFVWVGKRLYDIEQIGNWRGYQAVELGFPSGPVPELAEYKEGDNADEDSVYPWVPVEVFLGLMAKHGGIIPAYWPYLPPMDPPHLILPLLRLALFHTAGGPWEALNWKEIPVMLYAHEVTY